MFLIGEFAKLNMISTKTLRHYERMGILMPEKVDDETGYRYYCASQVKRLNQILALKESGMKLSEIAELFTDHLTPEELSGILKLKRIEMQNEIEESLDRLKRIDTYIDMLSEEDTKTYDIAIKSTDEIKVIGLRGMIDSYIDQKYLWDEFIEFLVERKIEVTTYCLAIYHSQYVEGVGVDVEVLLPYSGSIEQTDRIKCRTLPRVDKVASIIHLGPHINLPITYGVMCRWLEKNSYSVCGDIREIFLKAAWNVDDEKDYITEIQVPIERRDTFGYKKSDNR